MKTKIYKPLTKEEFKKIRITLQENQQDFATRLGYASKCTIAFKESGKRKVNRQDELILKTYIDLIRDPLTNKL